MKTSHLLVTLLLSVLLSTVLSRHGFGLLTIFAACFALGIVGRAVSDRLSKE